MALATTIRERLTDSFGESMFITFCTCDNCGQEYLKFAYDDDAYNHGWAYNACATAMVASRSKQVQ